MSARIPIRLAAALALTLGGLTPAVLAAAAPAQAETCMGYEGHQIDSGPSILAWDYFQCGENRTNLPVVIIDETTNKEVAEGEGEAYYACPGTTENKYAAAGAVFDADCGSPA
jgi:hypothetical protein